MKAISMWQPWASLWLTDSKIHETRDWPTKHRGLLYVHAAKKLVSECGEELDEICIQRFGLNWRRTLPRGAVIGIVDLIDCVQFSDDGGLRPSAHRHDNLCGDFAPGRYGWRRGPHYDHIGPWPYRGRQGMWDISDLDTVANRVLDIESCASTVEAKP